MMKRTKMYEDCPVCEGYKRVKQRIKYRDGFREVETECWACRGTGYVNYEKPVHVTESKIAKMYHALGI